MTPISTAGLLRETHCHHLLANCLCETFAYRGGRRRQFICHVTYSSTGHLIPIQAIGNLHMMLGIFSYDKIIQIQINSNSVDAISM